MNSEAAAVKKKPAPERTWFQKNRIYVFMGVAVVGLLVLSGCAGAEDHAAGGVKDAVTGLDDGSATKAAAKAVVGNTDVASLKAENVRLTAENTALHREIAEQNARITRLEEMAKNQPIDRYAHADNYRGDFRPRYTSGIVEGEWDWQRRPMHDPRFGHMRFPQPHYQWYGGGHDMYNQQLAYMRNPYFQGPDYMNYHGYGARRMVMAGGSGYYGGNWHPGMQQGYPMQPGYGFPHQGGGSRLGVNIGGQFGNVRIGFGGLFRI